MIFSFSRLHFLLFFFRFRYLHGEKKLLSLLKLVKIICICDLLCFVLFMAKRFFSNLNCISGDSCRQNISFRDLYNCWRKLQWDKNFPTMIRSLFSQDDSWPWLQFPDFCGFFFFLRNYFSLFLSRKHLLCRDFPSHYGDGILRNTHASKMSFLSLSCFGKISANLVNEAKAPFIIFLDKTIGFFSSPNLAPSSWAN